MIWLSPDSRCFISRLYHIRKTRHYIILNCMLRYRTWVSLLMANDIACHLVLEQESFEEICLADVISCSSPSLIKGRDWINHVINTLLITQPSSCYEKMTSPEVDMEATNSSWCCQFLYSPVAYSVSGVFVWTALIITCFQVKIQ